MSQKENTKAAQFEPRGWIFFPALPCSGVIRKKMGESVGQGRIPPPDRSESQQVLRRLPVSSECSERKTPQETELLLYQDEIKAKGAAFCTAWILAIEE